MDTTAADQPMSDIESFVTASAEEQAPVNVVNGDTKAGDGATVALSADMSGGAGELEKDSSMDKDETGGNQQDADRVEVNEDQIDHDNDNSAKSAKATGGAEVDGENNADVNEDAVIRNAGSGESLGSKEEGDDKKASEAKGKTTSKAKKGKTASMTDGADDSNEVEAKSKDGKESSEGDESGTEDAIPNKSKKDAKNDEQSTADSRPPFIMPITKTEMLAFLDKHDGNETCRNVKECIAIARKMVDKQPEGVVDVKTMLARLDQWAVGAHPNKLTNIEIARVVIGRMEAEKAKEAEKAAAEKSEATPTKRKRQTKAKKGDGEEDGDGDGEEGTPAKKARTPKKSKGPTTPKKDKKAVEKVDTEEAEEED